MILYIGLFSCPECYVVECRATTHSDLVVRAKKLGVEVKVVHNASVMNAIGVCGLQLYRYGETISIPFFTETWRPDSFYEKIKRNRTLGLHTLCLLGKVDIFNALSLYFQFLLWTFLMSLCYTTLDLVVIESFGSHVL